LKEENGIMYGNIGPRLKVVEPLTIKNKDDIDEIRGYEREDALGPMDHSKPKFEDGNFGKH
jgi:hypothetical protein